MHTYGNKNIVRKATEQQSYSTYNNKTNSGNTVLKDTAQVVVNPVHTTTSVHRQPSNTRVTVSKHIESMKTSLQKQASEGGKIGHTLTTDKPQSATNNPPAAAMAVTRKQSISKPKVSSPGDWFTDNQDDNLL